MKKVFGLKRALAGAAGLFAMGSGVNASAQEDDTDAEVEDDSSVASSGGTTVSVVDGVATIDVAEEDETEDEVEDETEVEDEDEVEDEVEDETEDEEEVEDEDDESEISVDGGLSLVDGSGGDGNFAFIS